MEMVAKFGMNVERVSVGDKLECSLKCPFASEVHSHLNAKNAVCPVTILVLGAARLGQGDLIAENTSLTEKGAYVTLAPNNKR